MVDKKPLILWCFSILYIAQSMILLAHCQYINYMVPPLLPTHVINMCLIWHVHQNLLQLPLVSFQVAKLFLSDIFSIGEAITHFHNHPQNDLGILALFNDSLIIFFHNIWDIHELLWHMTFVDSQLNSHKQAISKTKALRQVTLAIILKESHRTINYNGRLVNIMPYPMHLIRRIYSRKLTTKVDFN